MRRALLVLVVALAATACQRPSHAECERLCWRYSELQFWAAFESQARDLSPADRATLKAEREEEWTALRAQPKNPGRDNCLLGCKQGGKKAQVRCVEAATTAAAATACLKID